MSRVLTQSVERLDPGMPFHIRLPGEDEYLERLGEGVRREDAQQRCGKD